DQLCQLAPHLVRVEIGGPCEGGAVHGLSCGRDGRGDSSTCGEISFKGAGMRSSWFFAAKPGCSSCTLAFRGSSQSLGLARKLLQSIQRLQRLLRRKLVRIDRRQRLLDGGWSRLRP